ncbi:hypothetical protein D3C83_72390 [compost metagenome]
MARVHRLVDGVGDDAGGDDRQEPPSIDESTQEEHRFAAARGLIGVVGDCRADEEHAERGDESAACRDAEPADVLNPFPEVRAQS